MLVLSRQRDETIMIGDEIEITVVDIRGDKVRLGITAPTRISVHRKEVYDAIRAENQRAAQINQADVGSLRTALAGGQRRGASSHPIPFATAPSLARARLTGTEGGLPASRGPTNAAAAPAPSASPNPPPHSLPLPPRMSRL
jgi:carbon storage regulator